MASEKDIRNPVPLTAQKPRPNPILSRFSSDSNISSDVPAVVTTLSEDYKSPITPTEPKNLFHKPGFLSTGDHFREFERSVSPFGGSVHNDYISDEEGIVQPPKISYAELIQEQIDLRLASSQNPAVVMELDLDGNIRYLSKNWEVIVGTNTRKLVGKPISNIIIGNSEEDLKVFNNALEQMIREDASYKVKFVTATNDTQFTVNESHNSGRITPSNSMDDRLIQDVSNVDVRAYTQYELDQNDVDASQDGLDSGSDLSNSLSSKVSNNGDVIELEAQGILIHDPKTKLPNHSIWTIKPFTYIDLELTLPTNLIDLLGFGSEIFEGYLLSLQEMGIIDEVSVPQPKSVLCRICEMTVPAWFIERHSDLCIVEHRVNEELQNCHDLIADQRDLILKISESLWLQNFEGSSSPVSSSSSVLLSSSSTSSASGIMYDYKGIPLPSVPNDAASSPRLAPMKNLSAPNILQSRKFPFGVLHRLVELCDEALQINPAERTEESGILQFSPDTDRAIHSVANWKVIEISDLAIRTIVEDTQSLVNDKVDTLSRLISILQYSDKIKAEVDELVLDTVQKTVLKLKEQTRINENSTAHRHSSTLLTKSSFYYDTKEIKDMDQTYSLSDPIQLPQSIPPSPLVHPSPQLADELVEARSHSHTPSEYLFRGRATPVDIPRPPASQLSSSRGSSLSGRSRHNSKDVNLLESLQDLELKKSQDNFSNNLSFSSPRRHASPAPYVEKQALLSFQRNTNSRFDLPITSPSVNHAEINDQLIQPPSIMSSFQERRSNSGGSVSSSGSNNIHHLSVNIGSVKSNVAKPPLSPLLVSQTPTTKTSSGTIKDYEVIKAISKGAFGSVFLAKKKVTGDYVAIKCLKKRDMIAKNQILNVRSERAVMMKQTDSPYVAQLYCTFQTKDYLYLVMEYLNGGDCATLLKVLGTLGNEWAKRYISEVVVGITDLHRRGIIHRDLKPDNLLIDSTGHLKLTDFGLLRIGVVGRQNRPHRKSSTAEGIELFRRSVLQNRSQDSPQESNHKRNNSVTPFSLSPTFEHSRLNNLTPPDIDSNVNYSGRSYFRHSGTGTGRSGSGSSSIDSPVLKPLLPRTSSESSFAIIDDDFQVSPGQNPNPVVSYALFDPDASNQVKHFVGTPDYLSPETIEGEQQGEYSDWWSIGCILFEFLFGYPPFHASTPDQVFKNILACNIDWPPLSEDEMAEVCPPAAEDLINKLLTLNPAERLGSRGPEEIQQHPYFKEINWSTLYEQESSFIPTIDDPELTDYFDARGADISHFPKDDSDEENSLPPASPLLTPLSVDGTLRPGKKKERRGSKLADPSEFGSFHFRNLNVLEKANKDVINRLKNEHLEHRNSFSSSSSDSVSMTRSRGYSFGSTSNNPGSPFKRPVSPVNPINRAGSPNKEESGYKHERVGSYASTHSSGDEYFYDANKVSPASEAFPVLPKVTHRSSLNSLTKQVLNKSVNDLNSPSSSDTEESKSSALLRIRKRRESSRRTGSSSVTNEILSSTPLLESSSSNLSTPSKNEPIKAAKDMDVLYCEPIPIVRHTVCKLLENAGCIVVPVSNGDELIRRATSQVKFDLIFTALKISKVDAIDAVKLIKYTTGINATTPVIAITGYAKEATALGVFDDVLEKPVDGVTIKSCLQKFDFTTENSSRFEVDLAKNNEHAIDSDTDTNRSNDCI